MKDDEKKTPEEETEKTDEQTEENAPEPSESAEKVPEEVPETEQEETSENTEQNELDELKAENLRLKTQLEAMKIGFTSDNVEDAVILAEAIVKRDGKDITAALNAVAEKYPDWKVGSKNEKKPSGFRVGADSSEKKPKTDESRLSAAFGIKKK